MVFTIYARCNIELRRQREVFHDCTLAHEKNENQTYVTACCHYSMFTPIEPSPVKGEGSYPLLPFDGEDKGGVNRPQSLISKEIVRRE